jgi:hypothetical protein
LTPQTRRIIGPRNPTPLAVFHLLDLPPNGGISSRQAKIKKIKNEFFVRLFIDVSLRFARLITCSELIIGPHLLWVNPVPEDLVWVNSSSQRESTSFLGYTI